MNKRMKKSLWALVGTMLCGCLLLAPGARAAETTALEDALEQTARLQQLAEEYAAGQQTETEPLTLTINYIRAQRYADTTWDMILGEPSEEFAGFVEQQAPELAQLQTRENVEIPATGEPVDFVHLVAGIGATWKRLPVVCTWGGDCIQLAGSVQGSGMDEESCIQQLKPYFACEDENASLLPKSDWLADLDGVNIGSTLTQDSDLAESIREYYRSISTGERARRFVLAQFGEVDTGDQQAFRQQVKDKFFSDSGVQLLLLSQKQMTLDEERNFVVVDSLNAPLNAVCSLTADTPGGNAGRSKGNRRGRGDAAGSRGDAEPGTDKSAGRSPAHRTGAGAELAGPNHGKVLLAALGAGRGGAVLRAGAGGIVTQKPLTCSFRGSFAVCSYSVQIRLV